MIDHDQIGHAEPPLCSRRRSRLKGAPGHWQSPPRAALGEDFRVAHPREDLLHRDTGGSGAGDPSRCRRAGPGRADAQRYRHHRPRRWRRRIARCVPPPVATFLLSSATEPEELLAQCRTGRADGVQIVDAVDPAAYALLRRELPALQLVQVIHVTGDATVAEALALAHPGRRAAARQRQLPMRRCGRWAAPARSMTGRSADGSSRARPCRCSSPAA